MKMRGLPYLTEQSGIIMVGALIITIFFLVVSLGVAEVSANHYVNTKRTLDAYDAINAADAGADAFMYNINQDSSYQGTTNAPSGATNSCTGYTTTTVVLSINSTQGKLTYESCVQNGSLATEKIVYATGKVYLPASASTPKITRKIKLVINQQLPTNYTIMTGPGGLVLSNNVAITNGPVYVGGTLTMNNNSTIGSAITPTTVYAADVDCPRPTADSSYPATCSSGNTIVLSNGAHIYSDYTHAQNSVSRPSQVTGTIDHNVPAISFPTADHGTLTSGIGSPIGSSSCGNNQTLHVKGHYSSISLSNNCTLELDGDTWIDGNLTTGNSDTITVLSSLSTAPNLIIDGSSGFTTGNNTNITANSSGAGINIYTFWSAASCSPSCSSVTGTDLATSQAHTTINLSNNVSGSANIKFFARWTKLILGNNATVGQLIGQTVVLNNNGNILFGNFAGGTPGGWDVHYYEQVFQ